MRPIVVTSAIALALLLSYAPACAEEPPKPADDPFFALFTTAGRVWVLKRVPKPGQEGGDTETTFHRFEIFAVHADHSEYGQANAVSATDTSSEDMLIVNIKFKKEDAAFRDPIGFQKGPKEKVKTAAGTFECIKWVGPEGEGVWRSTEFPGLTVRSDDRFALRELISFDFIEGDPVAADPKVKPKKIKPKKEDPDEHRLYTKKGRKWLYKVSTFSGPKDKRSRRFDIKQYEVTASNAEGATLEISRLSMLKEKIKGESPEVQQLKFENFADYTHPVERNKEDRTERRKCVAGLYNCTVYSFTDAEGRDGLAWYAKEWPGLMVRRTIKGTDYEQVTELTEFNE